MPLADLHPPTIERKGSPKNHPVRHLQIVQPKGVVVDPLVQASAVGKLNIAKEGFEGLGKGLAYEPTDYPSDATGAIGPKYFIEWVNGVFGIFEKSSEKIRYGPVNGSTIWQGFGDRIEHNPAHRCGTNNDGDPIVLYDRFANRWLLTQFAFRDGPPYLQCIAVSTSDDPLGTYARYAFTFDSFNDYPKFAVWTNGYYASFNLFERPSDGAGKGSALCSFERAEMLKGGRARMICFPQAKHQGMLPTDADNLPPNSQGTLESPVLYFNLDSNTLSAWAFQVNWSDPATSSFKRRSIENAKPFIPGCKSQPGEDRCQTVAQKGTPQLLESMGDRLMYRVAYRRFADHESWVVNHTARVPDNTENSPSHLGIRWYELRSRANALFVYQSGTYSPTALSRWMGGIAMDKRGDLAIAFTSSGPDDYPSLRVAGREVKTNLPLNVLSNEEVLISSGISQPIPFWGDYATVTLDPEDDCTFWYFAQYLVRDDRQRWHTYISRFRFEACK